MKNSILLILSVLVFPLLLSADAGHPLEERLRKSSPGLPEFRVFADMSGVIRGVRSLPAEKKGGVFKLKTLADVHTISMLDVTGVKEADLEGLSAFKELRTLRIAADKVTGLENASLPGLIRLDLSGTQVKDISWIRNFPGLRILQLPESVTDIRALKGRSFRALSVPGVLNSDHVCRSLNITVAIRTAHAYRRPGRNRVPPVSLLRDRKGKVTKLRFFRLTPPPAKLRGFAGELFPEVRNNDMLPPLAEDHPEFKNIKRTEPFPAALLRRESRSLRVLDLRALRGVVFAGESFPELRELYLSGAVEGLHTIKAPKLTKVVLDMVEGALPDSSLAGRRERAIYAFSLPAREGVKKIRLAKGWKLDKLTIRPLRDEFDFSSLQGVQVKSLKCYTAGKTLAFLKGRKISRLVLDAPFVSGKGSSVLGTLPLKELTIALSPNADYSFLKKLKLRQLILSNCAGGNFSLQWLQQMPLEDLRLRNCFKRSVDFTSLKLPVLKVFVLDGVTFTRAGFLSNFPKLESLALENCVFAPDGLSLKTPDIDYLCGDRLSKGILKLEKLRDLRLGAIGVFSSGERLANYEFPLERFKVLKIENLSFCGARADFAKEFAALKRLKIDDISREGITPLEVKAAHELETLVLTHVRPRPDLPVPEQRFLFRRPRIPAPRKEPGVAAQVFEGGPGGFNGGFLR